ncbi:MAG: acetolactate synthase small subunit [Thermodesulfobacteriota bacterium]|jgi:acetolactate synthase-1/3 small subunit|nr:MAG: acetolactate synthase small subunit [Thermodesulfobacteriota bacterium]
MQHTLSILVENKPGVLSRIAGLFSGRGFNIESLSVAETLDATISRMTIVTRGNDQILEQIIKQLNKLVNVIKVIDFVNGDFVNREMALIKVTVADENRSELLNIVDIFRGKVVDVGPDAYVVEVTGDGGKLDAIINLCKPMGIKEVARTGKVAMMRGTKQKG